MENNIILYTLDCPNCETLEKILKENKIEYSVCKNLEEMKQLGLKSVPFLKVGEKMLNFTQAIKWITNKK